MAGIRDVYTDDQPCIFGGKGKQKNCHVFNFFILTERVQKFRNLTHLGRERNTFLSEKIFSFLSKMFYKDIDADMQRKQTVQSP